MKERALIVTRNFPPLVGGMEKLMFHAFQELAHTYRCDVIGPHGCGEKISQPHRAVECPVDSASRYLFAALTKSVATARQGSYRFSFSGSGLTAPIGLALRTLYGIPAVTFVHGLDLVVDHPLYQSLFLPAIRRADLVIANSHNTAKIAKAKGVPVDRVKVLFPGVTIPAQVGSGDSFRQRHDLVGKKILLSVGRLVPRKGIFDFLRHSFPSVVEKCPEAVLVVIGAAAKDALKKNRDLTADIRQIIAEQDLSDRVVLLGSVSDPELSEAYHAADVMIFPLRETAGDVEGFGMVALEAAAHGLPTVAFSVDGVPDAIGENRSGYLVEAMNYEKMSQVLAQVLLVEETVISARSCRDFAQQFVWSNFGTKIRQFVGELPS